jgi:hypothetical protein
LRDWQLQRPQLSGGASKGVPGVSTQASREASHDRDGATGQADDVVSDGADQMAGETPRLQPLKPGSLGPGKKCSIPDSLPSHPLAVPGQVLQVLWLRMHDVALDRPGSQNGFLRAGRKSVPEPVFRLAPLSLGAAASRRRGLHRAFGAPRLVPHGAACATALVCASPPPAARRRRSEADPPCLSTTFRTRDRRNGMSVWTMGLIL